MHELNDVEFMILYVLNKEKDQSGYIVNQNVKTIFRNIRTVGKTSLYNNLKKLCIKGLIIGKDEKNKNGKGPKGTIYNIEDDGLKNLKMSIIKGITRTKIDDPRFELAMSGASILNNNVLKKCFKERMMFLKKEYIKNKNNSGDIKNSLVDMYRVKKLKQEIIISMDFYKSDNLLMDQN